MSNTRVATRPEAWHGSWHLTNDAAGATSEMTAATATERFDGFGHLHLTDDGDDSSDSFERSPSSLRSHYLHPPWMACAPEIGSGVGSVAPTVQIRPAPSNGGLVFAWRDYGMRTWRHVDVLAKQMTLCEICGACATVQNGVQSGSALFSENDWQDPNGIVGRRETAMEREN